MRSSLMRAAVLAAVALPLALPACTTLGPDDKAQLDQSVGAAEAAKAAAQAAQTAARAAQAAAERAAKAAEESAAAAKSAAEKADRIHRQSLRK